MTWCFRDWAGRVLFPASLTLMVGLACVIIKEPEPPRPRASPVELLTKLPLGFEPNRGQTHSQVQFLSRRPGPQVYLTRNDVVVGDVHMRLVGGNPSPLVEGLEELPGKSHYFIGNERNRWCTNVPGYAGVRYRQVYPGVDLIFYGNQNQLEYDFVVAPGTDPGVVRVEFDGVEEMELEEGGDLVLRTANGELRQRAPVFYQQVGGSRREIKGRCVRQGERQIGFEVEGHDPGLPVVIDPLLTYSSFLGGRAGDVIHGIAVDASGNVYITGSTESGNFPTANPFQATNRRAPDAFVTKINPAGTALIYSTYLGGSGLFGDEATAIALDSVGNAYVTGWTGSTDFLTVNALQSALAGQIDAFVAKISDTAPPPPSSNLKLYFSNDPDPHPFFIFYTYQTRTPTFVVADVNPTNVTGTWFEVNVKFDVPSALAPNPVRLDDGKPIPFSFLVGPFSDKNFTSIQFNSSEYLHLEVTRTSVPALAMLAIDMIGRGRFGVELKPDAIDLTKAVVLDTLTEFLATVKGGKCGAELAAFGANMFDHKRKGAIKRLAKFILCTKTMKKQTLRLIRLFFGRENSVKYASFFSRKLPTIISIFLNAKPVTELLVGTFDADINGFVRLEARP